MKIFTHFTTTWYHMIKFASNWSWGFDQKSSVLVFRYTIARQNDLHWHIDSNFWYGLLQWYRKCDRNVSRYFIYFSAVDLILIGLLFEGPNLVFKGEITVNRVTIESNESLDWFFWNNEHSPFNQAFSNVSKKIE